MLQARSFSAQRALHHRGTDDSGLEILPISCQSDLPTGHYHFITLALPY
jgi:hypothetical protein